MNVSFVKEVLNSVNTSNAMMNATVNATRMPKFFVNHQVSVITREDH